MSCFVYKIENTVNGKCYIGSSIELKRRKYSHFHKLKSGVHHSRKLQRAWDKYGGEKFVFTVLFACSPDQRVFYEQSMIDGYNAHKDGYNVLPLAGTIQGISRTPEWQEKIKASIYARSKKLLWKGRLLTFKEIAAIEGVDDELISRRVLEQGFSIEDAVATPRYKHAKCLGRLSAFGRTQSLDDWAVEFKRSSHTLKKWLAKGKTLESYPSYRDSKHVWVNRTKPKALL